MTGLRAAEKLQSVLDGRERGTDVLELKVQLGKISEAVRCQPQWMGRRSSRSWRSWSSTRRRLTSARTPSMKLTTPTTRPSSSTATTSFDLRPVAPRPAIGLFRSGMPAESAEKWGRWRIQANGRAAERIDATRQASRRRALTTVPGRVYNIDIPSSRLRLAFGAGQ